MSANNTGLDQATHMEDLKHSLANSPTPTALLSEAWASSEQNMAARHYMAGMLDALRYAKAITLEEYNYWYEFNS
ncbi:hypothetical protein [Teredinibacter purpureus]|uniref:hypothetical protein n=1 Tax=Teredinibacter purpureus TaxID=2731756 RepID=UPI0005F894C3|nr:hypothetical protein [Teredinibacter purpureus]